MSKFQREDRYLVLKRKDLEKLDHRMQGQLNEWLDRATIELPQRKYVVVESDWPEYETVFKMIEDRVNKETL
jgi:hypothetical protein